MGTSTSSGGAPSGVSFDPEWLDALAGEVDSAVEESISIQPVDSPSSVENESSSENLAVEAPPNPAKAPARRYAASRLRLGKYLKSGSKEDLKATLSQFTNRAQGGARRAAHRMRVSVTAASNLGAFLAEARTAQDVKVKAWVESVQARGLSAKDIAAELVEKIVPFGGTLDEELAKVAIDKALTNLLEGNPDVDLLQLTDGQILELVAAVIGHDVCNRVANELARTYETQKISARTIAGRFNQLREYVLSVAHQELKKIAHATSQFTAGALKRLAATITRNAFFVFGEE